ncbi:MAG TPA: mandelate racemase/muconate lactonizing enzyme family protein [Pseudonocardia sp.]|jgi:L-alanine-DL-glutamate epimerase-like enolase superfamily enzyme
MHIRHVEAIGLAGATPPGGWTRELEPDDAVHTLVLVHTDEGLTGVGAVSSTLALVRAALELLTPICLGQDPLQPGPLAETLRQNTFWLGHGGAVSHAISGIDIALWDLAGQALGQPIGRLLGGTYRRRVRPYASVLMEEPAALADRLTQLREYGFRAFKIGWGPFGRRDSTTDERLVRAAREAVGPSATLAVDAGGSDAFWPNALSWAVRTSHMLAEFDVAWFEEPLRPDAITDHAELRRRSAVPIAGGEVLARRQAFQPYLDAGSFDIVQPDVTKVGGLDEACRIGWSAEDRGVRLIPHGWNTAVGLAADLHLASALPGTDLVEYCPGAAYIDELIDQPWNLDQDGMLAVPDRPGLGIDLNPEALERYAVR